MIGIDTNILLRILVDDGSRHVALARAFAGSLAQKGVVLYVNRVTLAEFVWVLETTFGYAKSQVIAAIEALSDNAGYALEDADTVVAALTPFAQGPVDFSDYLMVAKNASVGCEYTATFDRAMRGLANAKIL